MQKQGHRLPGTNKDWLVQSNSSLFLYLFFFFPPLFLSYRIVPIMTFTLKTVLNTSIPNVLELMEYASPVMHKVSGTLLMHVQRPMRLKQLSVSFVCQGNVAG